MERCVDPDLVDGKPFALTPWVKPLSAYERIETHGRSCMRFG
jgi:hypothetical protein